MLVLGADIRSGVDFQAFKRADYRNAGPALRAQWAFWRKTAPLYGFGRHKLLPVVSNGEAIARYVGTYISKNIRQRSEANKGARLVRYIGFKAGDRKANTRLTWNNDNAISWRHKLKSWAKRNGMGEKEEIKNIFGPRWAYFLQAVILAENVGASYVYPSLKASPRDTEEKCARENRLWNALLKNAKKTRRLLTS